MQSNLIWNQLKKLKEAVVTAPILSFVIKGGNFILDTDASDTACGAVLSQIQNGNEKVIAYALNKFSDTKRNNCTNMF